MTLSKCMKGLNGTVRDRENVMRGLDHAPSTRAGPFFIRKLIFGQKIDIICLNDYIYKSGVEAAAPFVKKLRREVFSFEGVAQDSHVRRYQL